MARALDPVARALLALVQPGVDAHRAHVLASEQDHLALLEVGVAVGCALVTVPARHEEELGLARVLDGVRHLAGRHARQREVVDDWLLPKVGAVVRAREEAPEARGAHRREYLRIKLGGGLVRARTLEVDLVLQKLRDAEQRGYAGNLLVPAVKLAED